MQTFLPYPDYAESARVLDRRRLGKQRVESKQLLSGLLLDKYDRQKPDGLPVSAGWRNHIVSLMWRGHALALAEYTLEICSYWTNHWGYNDTCAEYVQSILPELRSRGESNEPPPWFGDERFHSSHRATLLAKAYGRINYDASDTWETEWYNQWEWKEAPCYGYIWPVSQRGHYVIPDNAEQPISISNVSSIMNAQDFQACYCQLSLQNPRCCMKVLENG